MAPAKSPLDFGKHVSGRHARDAAGREVVRPLCELDIPRRLGAWFHVLETREQELGQTHAVAGRESQQLVGQCSRRTISHGGDLEGRPWECIGAARVCQTTAWGGPPQLGDPGYRRVSQYINPRKAKMPTKRSSPAGRAKFTVAPAISSHPRFGTNDRLSRRLT